MSGTSPTYDAVFKSLLIGDSGVGKTCLMFRFADNAFCESFTATIGIDFKVKTIKTKDGTVIKLQLWDTAGQEKFFAITLPYYHNGSFDLSSQFRNANCVLLVYDVTRASSFENVKRWMNCIDQHAPEHVIRVLVANKCDLSQTRVVRRRDGERLAANYAVRYYETSAKTSENVAQMFSELTEYMLSTKRALDEGLSKKEEGESKQQASETIARLGGRSDILDISKVKESVANCCSM